MESQNKSNQEQTGTDAQTNKVKAIPQFNNSNINIEYSSLYSDDEQSTFSNTYSLFGVKCQTPISEDIFRKEQFESPQKLKTIFKQNEPFTQKFQQRFRDIVCNIVFSSVKRGYKIRVPLKYIRDIVNKTNQTRSNDEEQYANGEFWQYKDQNDKSYTLSEKYFLEYLVSWLQDSSLIQFINTYKLQSFIPLKVFKKFKGELIERPLYYHHFMNCTPGLHVVLHQKHKIKAKKLFFNRIIGAQMPQNIDENNHFQTIPYIFYNIYRNQKYNVHLSYLPSLKDQENLQKKFQQYSEIMQQSANFILIHLNSRQNNFRQDFQVTIKNCQNKIKQGNLTFLISGQPKYQANQSRRRKYVLQRLSKLLDRKPVKQVIFFPTFQQDTQPFELHECSNKLHELITNDKWKLNHFFANKIEELEKKKKINSLLSILIQIEQSPKKFISIIKKIKNQKIKQKGKQNLNNQIYEISPLLINLLQSIESINQFSYNDCLLKLKNIFSTIKQNERQYFSFDKFSSRLNEILKLNKKNFHQDQTQHFELIKIYIIKIFRTQFQNGRSFQLINGLTLEIPKQKLFKIIIGFSKFKNIYVIAIVGRQSGGKSLLSNSIFGCNNIVNQGKTTLGINATLIGQFLILDIQGFESTTRIQGQSQLKKQNFDHKLLINVLKISDLVLLINGSDIDKQLFTSIGQALNTEFMNGNNHLQFPHLMFLLNKINEENINQIHRQAIEEIKTKLIQTVPNISEYICFDQKFIKVVWAYINQSNQSRFGRVLVEKQKKKLELTQKFYQANKRLGSHIQEICKKRKNTNTSLRNQLGDEIRINKSISNVFQDLFLSWSLILKFPIFKSKLTKQMKDFVCKLQENQKNNQQKLSKQYQKILKELGEIQHLKEINRFTQKSLLLIEDRHEQIKNQLVRNFPLDTDFEKTSYIRNFESKFDSFVNNIKELLKISISKRSAELKLITERQNGFDQLIRKAFQLRKNRRKFLEQFKKNNQLQKDNEQELINQLLTKQFYAMWYKITHKLFKDLGRTKNATYLLQQISKQYDKASSVIFTNSDQIYGLISQEKFKSIQQIAKNFQNFEISDFASLKVINDQQTVTLSFLQQQNQDVLKISLEDFSNFYITNCMSIIYQQLIPPLERVHQTPDIIVDEITSMELNYLDCNKFYQKKYIKKYICFILKEINKLLDMQKIIYFLRKKLNVRYSKQIIENERFDLNNYDSQSYQKSQKQKQKIKKQVLQQIIKKITGSFSQLGLVCSIEYASQTFKIFNVNLIQSQQQINFQSLELFESWFQSKKFFISYKKFLRLQGKLYVIQSQKNSLNDGYQRVCCFNICKRALKADYQNIDGVTDLLKDYINKKNYDRIIQSLFTIEFSNFIIKEINFEKFFKQISQKVIKQFNESYTKQSMIQNCLNFIRNQIKIFNADLMQISYKLTYSFVQKIHQFTIGLIWKKFEFFQYKKNQKLIKDFQSQQINQYEKYLSIASNDIKKTSEAEAQNLMDEYRKFLANKVKFQLDKFILKQIGNFNSNLENSRIEIQKEYLSNIIKTQEPQKLLRYFYNQQLSLKKAHSNKVQQALLKLNYSVENQIRNKQGWFNICRSITELLNLVNGIHQTIKNEEPTFYNSEQIMKQDSQLNSLTKYCMSSMLYEAFFKLLEKGQNLSYQNPESNLRMGHYLKISHPIAQKFNIQFYKELKQKQKKLQITNYFYFIQELIKGLGSLKSEIQKKLCITSELSNKFQNDTRINLCSSLCECCGRLCQQINNHNVHSCKYLGHFYQGMKGYYVDQTLKVDSQDNFEKINQQRSSQLVIEQTSLEHRIRYASLIECHTKHQKFQIMHNGRLISFKQFKENKPYWNFSSNIINSLNDIKASRKINQQLWKMIGQDIWKLKNQTIICQPYRQTLTFINTRFSFIQQSWHYIFALDGSTSMRGSPWQIQIQQLKKILEMIEKGGKSKVSIIVFSTTSKIICKNIAPQQINCDNIKHPGGFTCPEDAFQNAVTIIEQFDTMNSFFIYITDGISQYPNRGINMMIDLRKEQIYKNKKIMFAQVIIDPSSSQRGSSLFTLFYRLISPNKEAILSHATLINEKLKGQFLIIQKFSQLYEKVKSMIENNRNQNFSDNSDQNIQIEQKQKQNIQYHSYFDKKQTQFSRLVTNNFHQTHQQEQNDKSNNPQCKNPNADQNRKRKESASIDLVIQKNYEVLLSSLKKIQIRQNNHSSSKNHTSSDNRNTSPHRKPFSS